VSAADFEALIRATYVEAYVQGAYHPKQERIMAKAHELARLYWRAIEPHFAAAAAPSQESEETT
jgi:hypothetical protein